MYRSTPYRTFPTSVRQQCLAIAALAILLAAPAPHAQVYKWIDENGKAHYSDKPSEHLQHKVQPVQAPTAKTPTESASADWQSRERDFQRRRAEQSTKEAQQPQGPTSEQRCAQARKAITGLDGAAVYRTNNKGERVYIEDTERNAIEQKARQDIAQHCKG
jgi:Domain of unknown function (DUF4124)